MSFAEVIIVVYMLAIVPVLWNLSEYIKQKARQIAIQNDKDCKEIKRNQTIRLNRRSENSGKEGIKRIGLFF